jgi:signal transduction histidine kinase
MHLHPNPNEKGNILVVDDTPDNLRLLSAMLNTQGYEVRKALNGKMALTACQMFLPDLILLDINMPDMNGYEVCKLLKADDATSGVPIIFISALDDVLDKVKAFDVGGVDYITKPFHGAEVILRIENQINLSLLQRALQEKNSLLQRTLEDLKLAQVKRIQSEKMASLGQLVAGVAHEVNNPISFIYGNLQYTSQYIKELQKLINLYQEEYPQPTENIENRIKEIDLNFLINDLENSMGAMYRGAERIKTIVQALQNFSRHDEAEMKQVNIHKGIDSTLLMLGHRLKENSQRPAIEIVKDYGRLPLVTCYVSELNQVFMHVINNAIDALNIGIGSNKWSLATKGEKQSNANITTVPKPHIYIRTEITNSETVRVLVVDNGPGIGKEIRARVFDPFFTTKSVGQGSGLGLSISYQIVVQKHKGQLSCTSSQGQGAEFLIEIPVLQLN